MNKDHDPLPQINLALLFGEESTLPFYYRKLAGNISDVKTVRNLLAELDYLGLNRIKLVMDRGFYSEDNINALYHDHLKFLMATKVLLKFVQQELNKVRKTIPHTPTTTLPASYTAIRKQSFGTTHRNCRTRAMS